MQRCNRKTYIVGHMLFLFIVFVFPCAMMSFAQDTPYKALYSDKALRDEKVQTLYQRSQQEKMKAEQWAKNRRFPIRFKVGMTEFELMRIEDGRPIYYQTMNMNAAISTAAHQVRNVPPYNVDGSSLTVGIWDGGSIRDTHQEFDGRVALQDDETLSEHATHVGGTVGAKGVNPKAQGMATTVFIDSYDWTDDEAEMTERAASHPNEAGKIYISNHSYGPSVGWSWGVSGNPGWHWLWFPFPITKPEPLFGMYYQYSQEQDQIAYNAPYYLIVRAAGNDRNNNPQAGEIIYYYEDDAWQATVYDGGVEHPQGDGKYKDGYDTIPYPGIAKNILTVGAVDDAVLNGNRSLSQALMSSFSGWGPADDGRIKPDIVGNGIGLYSTLEKSDTDYTSESELSRYSGTSMSSPNVTGSAALLIDYYSQLHPDSAMRSSTLKGLILHTADDLGNTGPDYSYGWGLMNTKAAANLIKADHAAGEFSGEIVEEYLDSDSPLRTYVFYNNGTQPFKVTLCWTDPPGISNFIHDDRTPKLINDLDVRILNEDSSTTYLPFILDVNTPAIPATTGDNVVDNVEQILVDAGVMPGFYTITISHKGNLTNAHQYYSLIVSGDMTPPPCPDRTLCNDDFEKDLLYWRDTNNTSIITGRTGNGIQVNNDAANSDVYQFMTGIFDSGKWYEVSAWCKAEAGEQCGIYLGDANTWHNPPAHERESRTFLWGNGEWQRISTALYLDESERLSVYLYAKMTGSSVIYDDVSITELPACPENEVCNGDFEQGQAYWRDLENISIVNGRSGQGVQVRHDESNSDVYQFMAGVFQPDTYQASVWCKAEPGTECGIYLGDANTWYNPPAHEREARASIPGNGEWQRLSVMLTLDEAEMLSVYLYANTPDSQVVYDDVTIQPYIPFTAYLAEGYTRNGGIVYLPLFNPNAQEAQVNVTLMKEDGSTVPYSLTLPARRRTVLSAKAIVGEDAFATEVESDLPLVMERSAYWPAGGAGMADGHTTLAMSDLATTWHFAEGYNSSQQTTYLLLVNPDEMFNAYVTLTFFFPGGTSLVKQVMIPPSTRMPIVTSAWIPSGGFSVTLESDFPIMAERALYWSADGVERAGGHDTIGVSELSSTWFFAEGKTGGTANYKTYYLFMNPNNQDAHLNVTFITADGTTQEYPMTVRAHSRGTIIMEYVIPEGDYGAAVISDLPILAERAMYWDAGGAEKAGGHATIGSPSLDTTWYLADGKNRADWRTYITLMNPGDAASEVTLAFIKDDGSTVPYSLTLPAQRRIAISTNAIVPDSGFSTIVTSDLPVMAERSMYWSAGGVGQAGGHCTIGTSHQQLTTQAIQHQSVPTYLLTVLKSGSGSGQVVGEGIDCGHDCTERYPEGILLNLKAIPKQGSTFRGWLVNGEPADGILQIEATTTVTATFETE